MTPNTRCEGLLQLREPDCSAKATLIVLAMIYNRESMFFKQSSILGGVQTRVVQWLAFQLSDNFPV
jgi:hypothetical protein